nr:uncharacterized protein LOC121829671 [Peromyscus maniculatus bairdii]
MVARGAPTKRGPGPRGRGAQRRTLAPERIGGWAEPGPRCLPRCAVLRVRLLIGSAAAAAAAAAARSQVRTTERGARRVPRARDPPGSGSELRNPRTLGATSPHLFPLLVSAPQRACLRPHLGETLQPWVSQPGQCFLPRPRVPPEAVRAGHPSASCRRCGVRSHCSPPTPRAGVTAATRTCRCVAWRSTGRNSHLTVNLASEHPRRRGPGAATSAVQLWLSPRGRGSERLQQRRCGPQAGFVHRGAARPPQDGREVLQPAPCAPDPPGPGPLPPACEWPDLRGGSWNPSMDGKPWP